MTEKFKVAFDVSGLDPSFKEHSIRGIGRYVKELDSFFRSRSEQDLEITNFSHRDLIGKGIVDKLIDCAPAGRTTLRQQLLYPYRLSNGPLSKVDLVHFPAHMDGPTWSSTPVALTVLDLIPLVLKDLYKAAKPSWRFHFARWLELRAMRHAELIFAISESTARDVNRILNIPNERIVVTPLGVDPSFFEVVDLRGSRNTEKRLAICNRYGLPQDRKILLYVGGIDPRKNASKMLEALKAYNEACQNNGKPKAFLVMAGQISQDREFPKLEAHINKLGVSSDLKLTGYIDDQSLKELLGFADLFLFPSLYEGFGLPVLEAMAAGLPVAAAKTSSIPEVLGEDGYWFDPLDLASMVHAIDNALSNPDFTNQKQINAQKRARSFTWERTGNATLNGYRLLMKLRQDSSKSYMIANG